jgi:hypothetical protein
MYSTCEFKVLEKNIILYQKQRRAANSHVYLSFREHVKREREF